MKIINKTNIVIPLDSEIINELGEKIFLEKFSESGGISSGRTSIIVSAENLDLRNLVFHLNGSEAEEFGLVLFAGGEGEPKKERSGRRNYITPAIEGFGQKIMLVGTRDYTKNLIYAIRNSRIRNFSAKRIFEEGIKEVCDVVMENSREFSRLCIAVDLSVLDSSVLQGNSAGGLASRELVYFLQRLKLLKNLRILLVIVDDCDNTSASASGIVKKIIAECN